MTGGRRAVAVALLALAGMVIVAAGVATWVRGVVLDRDAFVDALRPLSEDQDFRDGLADELTGRVVELQLTAGRDAEELAPLIEGALDTVLAGPLFRSMWAEAVARAHDQVARMVRDGGRRIELDLGQLLTRADHVLEEQGQDLLDEAQAERIDDIVVTRGDQVGRIAGALDLVARLAVVLPVVALALLAGVVLMARRRSLALAASGAAVAAGAAVTLAIAFLARRWVVGQADDGLRRVAVGDVWDGLLAPLHQQSLVLLGVGLAVAVGGWVAHLATRSDLEAEPPMVVENGVRW